MDRFFVRAREEPGLRHELTLHATGALCAWLERHAETGSALPWIPEATRPSASPEPHEIPEEDRHVVSHW